MQFLPPPPQQLAKKEPQKASAGKKKKGRAPADKPAEGQASQKSVSASKAPENESASETGQSPDAKDEKEPSKPAAKEKSSGTPSTKPDGSKETGKASADQRWTTLGSFASDSPYRILVTLCNKGASIERVELVERRSNGILRYRDLEHEDGYLGLACHDMPTGCQVTSVGPGTPATQARPADGTVHRGIIAGDIVVAVNGRRVQHAADVERFLQETRPGQTARIRVRRTVAGQTKTIEFAAELAHRPLELIQPEAPSGSTPINSFLLGLAQVGKQETKVGQDELPGFASLRNAIWQMEKPTRDEVVFRYRVAIGSEKDGKAEQLEFIKRYRIVPTPKKELAVHDAPTYHLLLQLEIKNLSRQPHKISYYLDGPNGLPTEGWWYANKINPSWGSAGARDVIWRVHDRRHSLRGAPQIYKEYKKDPKHPVKTILVDTPVAADRTLDYIGVDTQYFSAVLMQDPVDAPTPFVCRQAYAMPVGPVPELEGREVHLLNTSFRIASPAVTIAPGKAAVAKYHIFLGPKSPALLAKYDLAPIIEYGWFGWIAKPLGRVLHFFYYIVWNYGLAIILLTILVRGAMFPVGRKAARNAQIMQELAPELKALKEKYKNDMEKQAQAQRELWKKHNFNPLGGCWLMFLQLPIFIGLYRCLSVDIELRQAPLIPGIHWCSNLAGPDMFWNWESIGIDFLTGRNGWLGPYLNILPIITVILFIVQQKMFTPPATDEQSRMQQSMMKYMMVFMGVMFFKVAAGLCLYFIASSLWGIAERKMLPKTNIKTDENNTPTVDKTSTTTRTGSGRPARGETKEKKPSLIERIEQWQKMAEQKAKQQRTDKSRPSSRPRGKKRKR